MQFSFRPTRNTISPSLQRAFAKADNKRELLQAMGLAGTQLTIRAFTLSTLRPAPWAPRKGGGSHPLLIKYGDLQGSPFIAGMGADTVTIASSKDYASFHQQGTKSLPKRPFFPWDSSGRPTDALVKNVRAVLRAKLKI